MTHDLDEIRTRTLDLMEELGRRHMGRPLQELGWGFAFDHARRRMGVCKWRRQPTFKQICLSRHFAALNGWEVMEDVARHEIAHALDFEARGKSDHSRLWKLWARRCGADPTRVHEGAELALAEAKYIGTCPVCGKEHGFFRKPRLLHACPDCCAVHHNGAYDERFRLSLRDTTTGRAVAGPASRTRRRYKYTGVCPGCGGEIGIARRLKRTPACRACCDRHAGGRFDERYIYKVKQNY